MTLNGTRDGTKDGTVDGTLDGTYGSHPLSHPWSHPVSHLVDDYDAEIDDDHSLVRQIDRASIEPWHLSQQPLRLCRRPGKTGRLTSSGELRLEDRCSKVLSGEG